MNAMEELENAIIRQADSMGMEPGTDEFEDFVMRRIFIPENRSIKASKGSSFKIRFDYAVTDIDAKFVQYRYVRSLYRWCKLNKGICLGHAAEILQMDPETIKSMGLRGDAFGFGNFATMLDGSDDGTYNTSHPDVMSEGNRGTVGYWNH